MSKQDLGEGSPAQPLRIALGKARVMGEANSLPRSLAMTSWADCSNQMSCFSGAATLSNQSAATANDRLMSWRPRNSLSPADTKNQAYCASVAPLRNGFKIGEIFRLWQIPRVALLPAIVQRCSGPR